MSRLKGLGIIVLDEADVVDALRLNVGKLQRTLNKTKYLLGRAELRRQRYKAQAKIDREYSDRLKAEQLVLREALVRISHMAGPGESGTGAGGWILTLEAPAIALTALDHIAREAPS